MPAITITTSSLLSFGNRDGIVAKTGNINDGDTWVTGLSSIDHVIISNTVSGITHGYTASGGTITFHLSAGLTAPTVLAIGFN
jgi:hypothetical protein